MVTHRKSWLGALGALVLLGLCWAPSESAGGSSDALAHRERAAEQLAARAARLEQRHLACVAERETLSQAILARKAACEAEMEHFHECRAARRDLEGADLWTCGLGLAMGVASSVATTSANLSECGLAGAPEERSSCPVPACTLDPVEIEREVLADHGALTMPSCDDPSA